MLSALSWPLEVNVIRQHKVSNTFGMVRTKADGTPKAHQGWDLAARVGTTIYAVADGEVVFVQNGGDYGQQLCLSFEYDEKTYYAFYAHLSQVTVAKGDAVSIGQSIGLTGKSGNAYNLPAAEDHLHFEIRTQAHCGLGLAGRVSPLQLYKICPLQAPVYGRISGLSGVPV